jgi:hypothetical protein
MESYGACAPPFLVWNVDPTLQAMAFDVLGAKRMDKPLRHFGPCLTSPHNRYSFEILDLCAVDLECVTSYPQALSNQHVCNDSFKTALPDRLSILDKTAGRARFQRILLGFQRLTLLHGPP